MKVVSIGGIANDGINYDMWLELPFTQPAMKLERTMREGGDPVVTRARREAFGMTLHMQVFGATEAATKTLREALLAALDTESTAIALVVADDDDGDERYRMVVVQAVDEQRPEQGAGAQLAATLVVHGEMRWRSTTANSTTWNITASGDTTVIANGGSLPVRPTYTIQPTSANVTKFAYRAFVLVKWSGRAATNYPVALASPVAGWDTDALITAGKISGEDNIAVSVDGALRKRWIVDYDTADTVVWTNLDFIWCPLVSLKVGFGAGDTVTELQALEPINLFPFQGTLVVGTELFTYTGKREEDNTFTGVTRAVKESTAAVHVGTDEDPDNSQAIELVQHDIWLLYGGGGSFTNTDDTTGPTEESGLGEDTLKPMFELADSTNLTWKFEYFGQAGSSYYNNENAYRPMSWRSTPDGAGVEGSTASDLYDKLLLWTVDRFDRYGHSWWSIPTANRVAAARIIGSSWSEPQAEAPNQAGLALIKNGFVSDAYINVNVLLGDPDVGRGDFDLTTTRDADWSDSVRFYLRTAGNMQITLDVAYLTWREYPYVTRYTEQTMYDLDLLLENVTTGQSITLVGQMNLNEQLEVDTEAHTVTNLNDSANQYQMLLRSTRRREILPLQPGNNTLRATETGLAGMTITIEFEERSYS